MRRVATQIKLLSILIGAFQYQAIRRNKATPAPVPPGGYGVAVAVQRVSHYAKRKSEIKTLPAKNRKMTSFAASVAVALGASDTKFPTGVVDGSMEGKGLA